MALRILARELGIPALQRASGPRVLPSGGTSRPLTSGSYQGGRNNGAGAAAAAKKPAQGGKYVQPEDSQLQDLIEAKRAALMEIIRIQERRRRMIVGSALAGLAAAWIITEPEDDDYYYTWPSGEQ